MIIDLKAISSSLVHFAGIVERATEKMKKPKIKLSAKMHSERAVVVSDGQVLCDVRLKIKEKDIEFQIGYTIESAGKLDLIFLFAPNTVKEKFKTEDDFFEKKTVNYKNKEAWFALKDPYRMQFFSSRDDQEQIGVLTDVLNHLVEAL
jgi:hypothetical protein